MRRPDKGSRVTRVTRTGAKVESGLSRPEQMRRRFTWNRRCASVDQWCNTKFEDKHTIGYGHRVWKSFRQAFKSVWKKEEIKAMLQRLSLQREQLVIHLVVIMK